MEDLWYQLLTQGPVDTGDLGPKVGGEKWKYHPCWCHKWIQQALPSLHSPYGQAPLSCGCKVYAEFLQAWGAPGCWPASGCLNLAQYHRVYYAGWPPFYTYVRDRTPPTSWGFTGGGPRSMVRRWRVHSGDCETERPAPPWYDVEGNLIQVLHGSW